MTGEYAVKWSVVKGELLKRGVTVRELSRSIPRGYHCVVKTCDGLRHGQEVQEEIAAFLGIPSEELFGSAHWKHFKRSA